MKKLVAVILALSMSLFAIEHLPVPKTDFASSSMMLKQMLAKPPSELQPAMCVIVGTAYLDGSKEAGVARDAGKAELYLLHASQHGEVLADALLANLYLDQRRLDDYAKAMQRVMASGQERIAVPAGMLLSAFYGELGQNDDSVRVLRYVAERYGDSRAQFLAGYAIVNGEYGGNDAGLNDGKFLIYQACTNSKIDPAVQLRCTQIGFRE